nr:substrate-binding domain-containing protein [Spirochaetaceae bacterium]
GTGPFYWQIFFNIQSCLTKYNIFSSVIITHDIDSEYVNSRNRIVSSLRNKQLEGIIYFPVKGPKDDEIFELLNKAHEHVVLIDAKGDESNFHQIYIDNYNAGCKAAQAFIDRGHKEFLFIGGASVIFSAQERWQGFCDVLSEHGITMGKEREIYGEFRSGLTYQTVLDSWDNIPPFTAVFANNDDSAHGFMRAAWEKGKSCPEDYSIIGFDNNTEVDPYLRPSLSSFDQSLHEIGQKAAKTLVDLMRDRPVLEKKQTITPFLVTRESLDFAPGYSK